MAPKIVKRELFEQVISTKNHDIMFETKRT